MKKSDKIKKSEDEQHRDLEHYSPQQGLKTIDPKFKRTGVDRARRANQLAHDISFFYPKGTEPEDVVLQPAKSKYTVRLPKEHKIFDVEEHGDEHIRAVRDANQGVFNLDNFITRLKEHGFHGFKSRPQGIPMVALFDAAPIHSEEPVNKINKSEDALIKSKNVKEQKKQVFGITSQPSAKSLQREKHMQQIRDYARRRYGLEIKPSGGKINVKTGKRRSENPTLGVDKPDWRSGQLEAQANPDAMVHELGHLEIMPFGVGLEEGQNYMDKQYSDVQRQYGYMKQKKSQGEIQPMGIEQLLRRRMGLPANRSVAYVKSPDAPPRMAVDTGTLAGTRVPIGQTKQGQTKYGDLIRQSKFVSPENRERVDKIDRGELVYDKKRGWVQPDFSSKEGLKQNINALVNVRAREKAKDPTRKDAKTLMRSEDAEKDENKQLNYATMSKNLEKNDKYARNLSQFKNAALGLATAASLAASPNVQAEQQLKITPEKSTVQETQQAPPFDPKIIKQNILRSIAQVESSGGKNTQHTKLPYDSIHRGERAFGTYGLTPLLIRETAGMHKDILEKHPNLNKMYGDDMHNYLKKNPELEQEIASRHYDRLSKKFGHDPSKIGFAWLNGITGTIKALNRGANIDDHWHVKKINNALQQITSKQQTPSAPGLKNDKTR